MRDGVLRSDVLGLSHSTSPYTSSGASSGGSEVVGGSGGLHDADGWMADSHRISSPVRVSFSHWGMFVVLRRRDRVRQRQA